MGISECKNLIDKTGLELVEHGNSSFPIACYHDNLLKNPVEWHWHEELEFFLVTEGSTSVAIEGERYLVNEGEGFFINSGILHGCWNCGEAACRFHSLVFHPRLIGGDAESVFWIKYLNPIIHNTNFKSLFLDGNEEWKKTMLEKIEATWRACESEEQGFELKVRAELSELIYQLCVHAKAEHTVSEKMRKDSYRMKVMLEYINENFAENVTIESIGASVNVSESECLRCFRNTIGTTPIQYLKALRVKKAAEYLSNTSHKVVDIGVACGFQDMSYFAKTFKSVYGVTPSEYRKHSAFLQNSGTM